MTKHGERSMRHADEMRSIRNAAEAEKSMEREKLRRQVSRQEEREDRSEHAKKYEPRNP